MLAELLKPLSYVGKPLLEMVRLTQTRETTAYKTQRRTRLDFFSLFTQDGVHVITARDMAHSRTCYSFERKGIEWVVKTVYEDARPTKKREADADESKVLSWYWTHYSPSAMYCT